MEQKDIGDVLSNLAVDLTRGRDGRHLDEHTMGGLVVLSEVASRLDLPDAARFEKLLNVARRGYVKDIGAAVLRILTE